MPALLDCRPRRLGRQISTENAMKMRDRITLGLERRRAEAAAKSAKVESFLVRVSRRVLKARRGQ
jgi:hypothetical protein